MAFSSIGRSCGAAGESSGGGVEAGDAAGESSGGGVEAGDAAGESSGGGVDAGDAPGESSTVSPKYSSSEMSSTMMSIVSYGVVAAAVADSDSAAKIDCLADSNAVVHSATSLGGVVFAGANRNFFLVRRSQRYHTHNIGYLYRSAGGQGDGTNRCHRPLERRKRCSEKHLHYVSSVFAPM